MSWLNRAWVRLLPAERRDWVEAVWAEAHEVPAGSQRLAWQAGCVRLVVREAQLARRIGFLLLFGAAGAAAWQHGRSPRPALATAPRTRVTSSSR